MLKTREQNCHHTTPKKDNFVSFFKCFEILSCTFALSLFIYSKYSVAMKSLLNPFFASVHKENITFICNIFFIKFIFVNFEVFSRENTKIYRKKNAFVTLKDHKYNFLQNTPCRLINPAKTEISKISKQYLDQINNAIRQTSRYNQWTNTTAVISWFKNMFTKNNNCKFMKFDIENFYSSISEDSQKALESF